MAHVASMSIIVTYTVVIFWLWSYGYCSVPLDDFYDAGNLNCVKDDGYYYSELVNLASDFEFFGDKYRSIWITGHGVLFFVDNVTFSVALLNPFYVPNYWKSTKRVCWKETTSEKELERAGEEIRSYFPELVNFNVSWVLIVSWIDVTPWSCDFSGKKCAIGIPSNTFQAVLMTDDILSFVVYNYNKIGYSRHCCGIYPFYAQVGFNKGDGTHYHFLEGSGTAYINTVVSRSNVNRSGTFVFRLNGYMARPVKVADIVFLIDSSYSDKDHFDSVLQYIVNVTDNLNIAANETQVAVVSFSATAQEELDFLSCTNKDCVHDRVLNISHLNSTSHMETGLDMASDMFQWTKGGRQAAVKYVVVLSDGLVSERMKVKRKARLMSDRHGGITVVSVGLGRSVYHTILESVAFNSSYLLAPDPGKLLDLLQLELQDRNTTDCVKEYNADILVMVETSTTSGKIYKTVMEFLQTFLSKINPNNYDNNITFSLAQYDNKTNYIIRECRLSNLQYIQDAIKALRQSPGEEPDWNSLLRFVDVHTSYTSVKIRKYVMFVTAGHIQKESVAHIKRQLVNLRDNNDVIVVMFGVADHTDWTVLEKVYDRGFYTFSTEDVDVASRVLWNDIKMTNCTII